jgi:hypothetical protein
MISIVNIVIDTPVIATTMQYKSWPGCVCITSAFSIHTAFHENGAQHGDDSDKEDTK